MHQDIVARNLLVDEDDNLRIFDFNYAVMIEKHYTRERDDIKGVMYDHAGRALPGLLSRGAGCGGGL